MYKHCAVRLIIPPRFPIAIITIDLKILHSYKVSLYESRLKIDVIGVKRALQLNVTATINITVYS